MLKIKNVTAKNFMSVGNNTQAVSFDTDSLTLVLGHNLDLGGDGSRNGTGKTTIINALSFALYGEALTNIRKDNLINKTNGKGMMTTVDFEINGTEYRIERGRRPNVLKFYIDGVEPGDNEQQGDMRETQKEIEKITSVLRAQGEPDFIDDIFSNKNQETSSENSEDGLVQVSLKLKDFAGLSPWA